MPIRPEMKALNLLERLVGWLRRLRGHVCGVDVGLDGAETTVWAKIRGDGTIEVIDIIKTKHANAPRNGPRGCWRRQWQLRSR